MMSIKNIIYDESGFTKREKNINKSLNISFLLNEKTHLYPENYRHSPIQTKSIKNKKEVHSFYDYLYILYEYLKWENIINIYDKINIILVDLEKIKKKLDIKSKYFFTTKTKIHKSLSAQIENIIELFKKLQSELNSNGSKNSGFIIKQRLIKELKNDDKINKFEFQLKYLDGINNYYGVIIVKTYTF